MMGLASLPEGTQGTMFSPPTDDIVAICKPRSEAGSCETVNLPHTDLGLSASRTRRHQCLVFTSHPIGGVLGGWMPAPNQALFE